METKNLMLKSLSRHSQHLGKTTDTLTCSRLFPKKVELQALMKYYDVDGDGNVSYEEFIRGLRYAVTTS